MKDSIHSLILKNNLPILFVSPHLDDAVFSAGALMRYLSQYASITLLNVFTKPGQYPITISGKKYLKLCNYNDINQLFADRKKEDREACQNFVDKIVNFDLIDALWRKKNDNNHSLLYKLLPELNHIYPTYRYHVIKGTISPSDNHTLNSVISSLKKFPKQSTVFCPFGIGDNVDHIIVRKACETVFSNTFLWSDYPYSDRVSVSPQLFISYKNFKFPISRFNKLKLMKLYRSQYAPVYPTTPILPPETFYYK